MSYVVVDASVWVSRLVPQDRYHQGVTAWLEAQRADGTGMLSPALLLPEVAGAISRRTATPRLGRQAVEVLQNLPELRLVEMDAELMRLAARLAADLGLRGADATYVAVAVRLDVPLATLDEEQKRRSSDLVAIQPLE